VQEEEEEEEEYSKYYKSEQLYRVARNKRRINDVNWRRVQGTSPKF